MKAEALVLKLLTGLRQGHSLNGIMQELSAMGFNELAGQLPDDDTKKAFWLNIYNAASIFLLKDNPQIITMHEGRKHFFRKRKIVVAGRGISLNFILYRILKNKPGSGFRGMLRGIFTPAYVKALRVKRFDPRIIFALSFGAVGCAPLRIFEKGKIDNQLELAAMSFLDSRVEYSSGENLVTVSQMFDWFSKDLGGEEGILELLRKYEKIPVDSKPLIIYDVFSWKPSST